MGSCRPQLTPVMKGALLVTFLLEPKVNAFILKVLPDASAGFLRRRNLALRHGISTSTSRMILNQKLPDRQFISILTVSEWRDFACDPELLHLWALYHTHHKSDGYPTKHAIAR